MRARTGTGGGRECARAHDRVCASTPLGTEPTQHSWGVSALGRAKRAQPPGGGARAGRARGHASGRAAIPVGAHAPIVPVERVEPRERGHRAHLIGDDRRGRRLLRTRALARHGARGGGRECRRPEGDGCDTGGLPRKLAGGAAGAASAARPARRWPRATAPRARRVTAARRRDKLGGAFLRARRSEQRGAAPVCARPRACSGWRPRPHPCWVGVGGEQVSSRGPGSELEGKRGDPCLGGARRASWRRPRRALRAASARSRSCAGATAGASRSCSRRRRRPTLHQRGRAPRETALGRRRTRLSEPGRTLPRHDKAGLHAVYIIVRCCSRHERADARSTRSAGHASRVASSVSVNCAVVFAIFEGDTASAHLRTPPVPPMSCAPSPHDGRTVPTGAVGACAGDHTACAAVDRMLCVPTTCASSHSHIPRSHSM